MAAPKKPQLVTDPADKIRFFGDLKNEIQTTLKITNKSDSKQAFKVKCTRNDMFRIRPPTGILDYNQSAVVMLMYKPMGEIPPEDKLNFGIYNIPAPEGCTPEGVWAEHYGPAQGEQRLKICFEK